MLMKNNIKTKIIINEFNNIIHNYSMLRSIHECNISNDMPGIDDGFITSIASRLHNGGKTNTLKTTNVMHLKQEERVKILSYAIYIS